MASSINSSRLSSKTNQRIPQPRDFNITALVVITSVPARFQHLRVCCVSGCGQSLSRERSPCRLWIHRPAVDLHSTSQPSPPGFSGRGLVVCPYSAWHGVWPAPSRNLRVTTYSWFGSGFLSENEPLLTLFRKPQGVHGIQDASHSLKSSVHDREFFSLTRRRSLVRSWSPCCPFKKPPLICNGEISFLLMLSWSFCCRSFQGLENSP